MKIPHIFMKRRSPFWQENWGIYRKMTAMKQLLSSIPLAAAALMLSIFSLKAHAQADRGTRTDSETLTGNRILTNSGTLTDSGTLTGNGTFTDSETLTGNGTFTDSGTLTGNGTVTDSGTLAGNWILKPVLASDTATGKIPTIRFNLATHTFSGSTGCNNMSGRFASAGNDLSFDRRITLTRKKCTGYNEAEFVANLLRVTSYKIEQGILTLMIGNAPISKWVRKTGSKEVARY